MEICKRCHGTGIESADVDPEHVRVFGATVQQFCPDCLTGNTLALKAQGSNLDPAKYPACQFEGAEACNDSGKLPDGTSCDCEKASILGFEWYGCSHEVAIKVMCALISSDYGSPDHWHPAIDQLGKIGDQEASNEVVTAHYTTWVQENPIVVQEALESCWLRRFL